MDVKKWPVLAQVLIALGCIGSLMSIVRGLSQQDIVLIIFGIAGLVIYWSVYKIKNWALIGLNIFLSLNILLNLINFFSKGGMTLSIFAVGFSMLLLGYFNSPKVKELFK